MARYETAATRELDRIAPGWRDDVRKCVEAAPPLTDEQRTAIALLLRRPKGHLPDTGLPVAEGGHEQMTARAVMSDPGQRRRPVQREETPP